MGATGHPQIWSVNFRGALRSESESDGDDAPRAHQIFSALFFSLFSHSSLVSAMGPHLRVGWRTRSGWAICRVSPHTVTRAPLGLADLGTASLEQLSLARCWGPALGAGGF